MNWFHLTDFLVLLNAKWISVHVKLVACVSFYEKKSCQVKRVNFPWKIIVYVLWKETPKYYYEFIEILEGKDWRSVRCDLICTQWITRLHLVGSDRNQRHFVYELLLFFSYLTIVIVKLRIIKMNEKYIASAQQLGTVWSCHYASDAFRSVE